MSRQKLASIHCDRFLDVKRDARTGLWSAVISGLVMYMLTTFYSVFYHTPVETDNFQVLARNRAIPVQEHLSTYPLVIRSLFYLLLCNGSKIVAFLGCAAQPHAQSRVVLSPTMSPFPLFYIFCFQSKTNKEEREQNCVLLQTNQHATPFTLDFSYYLPWYYCCVFLNWIEFTRYT